MKLIILLLIILICSSSFAKDDEKAAQDFADKNSCDVSKKEVVVCTVIMCDFGLLYGEWSSDCTKAKFKLAKWAANPFKKIPKCFNRDSDCKKDGKGKAADLKVEDCKLLDDIDERTACEHALDPDKGDIPIISDPKLPPIDDPYPKDPCFDKYKIEPDCEIYDIK